MLFRRTRSLHTIGQRVSGSANRPSYWFRIIIIIIISTKYTRTLGLCRRTTLPCNRLVGFNTLHVYLYTRAYLQTYFYIESLGCALRPLYSQRVQIPVRRRRHNTVSIAYQKKFACLVNVVISTIVYRIHLSVAVNIIFHVHRPRSGDSPKVRFICILCIVCTEMRQNRFRYFLTGLPPFSYFTFRRMKIYWLAQCRIIIPNAMVFFFLECSETTRYKLKKCIKYSVL